ncbi:winged helix-turn-helix domain-containing protein [Cellulomonas fimi]|uniref:winged helix-turn-helix domain-containing protein n=1 Tax=Cellulomonas fimi TaxID=1708 RepID=UPI0027B8817A|nr:winged helix-turn-helix domain-containing protein [Cellulomonas fimi]
MSTRDGSSTARSRVADAPATVDAGALAHEVQGGSLPPEPPGLTVDPDADARALASTLRLRILRLCLDEPRTNREIATALDRNPATVLHHVRTLVDRGFLVAQPVRRGTRGSREVPYRATGRTWQLRDQAGMGRTLLNAFFEEVALVDPETVNLTRLGLRLDADGYAELTARLGELADEFAARPATPGGTAYSLFVAVHEDVTRDAGGRPPRDEDSRPPAAREGA